MNPSLVPRGPRPSHPSVCRLQYTNAGESLVMTAMAPQLVYIMNRKPQPDSDVPRIHILYVMDTSSNAMKGSHTSTMAVMEDTDKYRLVRIPPSGCEPPVVGLTRIWKAPRTQPS